MNTVDLESKFRLNIDKNQMNIQELLMPVMKKSELFSSLFPLNHTAFTLVSTNLPTVVCKGTDVVDRLDTLVKGIVTKDR